MIKAVEFNVNEGDFKKYLEECLSEKNINFEIKTEDRWIQKFKDASKYYQVYCLYVDNNDINLVKQFIRDYENGTIITDKVKEFKNSSNEQNDNRYKIFTKKNFLKFYYGALIIIGLLIIIGISFAG